MWRGALLAGMGLFVLGGALRARIGLPYLRFTDEPQVVATAAEMAAAWDPNPRFFAYGSLMIQLDAAVDRAWMTLAGIAPADVITLYDVPDRFFVSHPELVWANRFVTVLVATAGLFGAAVLGRALARRIDPTWAEPGGVGAMLAVAGLPRYATHSAMATQDGPLTAFVLLAIAAAIEGNVLAAGLCAGFAASCKISAWLAVLPALVAVGFAPGRALGVIKAVGAAAVGFLVGTPFAVFDAATFLADVRLEAWHYGAARPEVGRGIPQLAHGLGGVVIEDLAVFGAILAGIGIYAVARRSLREIAVVGVFPVAFAAQMSLTTIEAQRNWLPVGALGAVFAILGVGLVSRRLTGQLAVAFPILAGMLLLAGVLGRVGTAGWEPADTRTRFAAEVASLAAKNGWTRVGVAREVKMHPRDLARLPGAFEVPLADRECRDADVFIVPAEGVPGVLAEIRGRNATRGEGVRFDPALALVPSGPARRPCPVRPPERRPPGLWERRANLEGGPDDGAQSSD